MAKEIIILRIFSGPGGDLNIGLLGWFTVPAANAIPIPNAVSAWSGASAAENSALAAGTTIEEGFEIQYPTSFTKAQIQADLVTKWNARQAQITARPNPNQFFGVFFDSSTGWSA